MPDGIINVVLNVTKNGIILDPTFSDNITVGGSHMSHHHQTVGSTEEALELPADIAAGNIQLLIVKHCGTAGYLSVGKTGNYFSDLYAGNFCVIPFPTAAVFVKASTGTIMAGIAVIEKAAS